MKYSPEGRFPLNSLITHPTFGIGKVVRHILPNKMDVAFGEEVKCLVCGKIINEDKIVNGSQRDSILPYSPYGIFKENDIINHKVFGIGKVVNYIYPHKIDVKFTTGIRHLKCGRHPKSLNSYLSLHTRQEKDDEFVFTGEEKNIVHASNKNINIGTDIDAGLKKEIKGPFCKMLPIVNEIDNIQQASPPLEYFPDRLYPLECIIHHKELGVGEVVAYVNQNEINVKFPDKTVPLMCGRLPESLLKKYSTNNSSQNENNEVACAAELNQNPLPHVGGVFCDTVASESSETQRLKGYLAEKLMQILSMRFPNGYRIDSPIELARLRSFTAKDFGEEITLSDEELKKEISTHGTAYERKIYAVSDQTKERIKKLAEKYFADGAQVIFFAEFYDKNENWLFGVSIVSEDMLKGILADLFPNLLFTQTYFGHTDASVYVVLEKEILRVWGDCVLLTYEQIAERLQYIPMERIRSALGQHRDFIWHCAGTFSHISKIDITDEERKLIRETAVQKCNALGYASLTNLSTEEIGARNFELSITAIHTAVFNLCLSDEFYLNGKIIARKGDVINALAIMKDCCQNIDKCSLDNLLDCANSLIGNIDPRISIEAGNAILIRIDSNAYVSDKYVYFDFDAVDVAIEMFINGNYLPLKSFTAFGAFPDCGQTWNLFLLESYCRRFSKKFRFDSLSVNSQNIGAVIRESCNLKYIDIMADAVVNIGVPLTDSAVGEFLLNFGYIGRRRASIIREITDKVKASRKRVD